MLFSHCVSVCGSVCFLVSVPPTTVWAQCEVSFHLVQQEVLMVQKEDCDLSQRTLFDARIETDSGDRNLRKLYSNESHISALHKLSIGRTTQAQGQFKKTIDCKHSSFLQRTYRLYHAKRKTYINNIRKLNPQTSLDPPHLRWTVDKSDKSLSDNSNLVFYYFHFSSVLYAA